MDLKGYLHPAYAHSLAEFGGLIELKRSGGWLLRRAIKDVEDHDAIGLYPYLTCLDWRALADDLGELQRSPLGLVSIAAAPDPFGTYDEDTLRDAFPDLCRIYKRHYVADLSLPYESIVSVHHRREVERAKRKLSVEVIDKPIDYLDQWIDLFGYSMRQFDIGGIQAFSAESFALQLKVPGTLLWLVRNDKSQLVAGSVTMMHGDAAYTHLLAATPAGRKYGASYAIYDANIRYLKDRVRWIDWGAAPGDTDAENGLKKFKSGWATGERPAYICGRIVSVERYEKLAAQNFTTGSAYFPCYRAPR